MLALWQHQPDAEVIRPKGQITRKGPRLQGPSAFFALSAWRFSSRYGKRKSPTPMQWTAGLLGVSGVSCYRGAYSKGVPSVANAGDPRQLLEVSLVRVSFDSQYHLNLHSPV